MDQAIRGKLLDPSLSIVGRPFKTGGDLISFIGHWKPVYVSATYCGRNRRQERRDRSQQVAECYRFRDIGITSALQAFLFILWRGKSGYGNDRDGVAARLRPVSVRWRVRGTSDPNSPASPRTARHPR